MAAEIPPFGMPEPDPAFKAGRAKRGTPRRELKFHAGVIVNGKAAQWMQHLSREDTLHQPMRSC
jgi:hypothetical protein